MYIKRFALIDDGIDEVNPFMSKGITPPYQKDCYSNLNRKFCKQTVETLRYASSDLGLQCLLMSRQSMLGLDGLNDY